MAKVNQEIQNLRRDEHHMLIEVVSKCVDDSVKMRMGQLYDELGPGSSGSLEKEKFTSSSPEAQKALDDFWDTIQSNFDSDGDDKIDCHEFFNGFVLMSYRALHHFARQNGFLSIAEEFQEWVNRFNAELHFKISSLQSFFADTLSK
jgi:hypothetical protein